jgi:hypothetical protein
MVQMRHRVANEVLSSQAHRLVARRRSQCRTSSY